MKIYWNKFDTWVGVFRKPIAEKYTMRYYLILIPCLVIEFDRRQYIK